MKKILNKKSWLLAVATAFAVATVGAVPAVMAEDVSEATGFTLSPMTQHIVLNPGDSYSSSIKVSNPASHTKDVDYKIEVQPFYVDENYNTIYEDVNNRSLMANWITIDSPDEGTVAPNETDEIVFTINVPEDAPAGGQYADIRAISVNKNETGGGGGSAIGEQIAIGHLIFAEIAGETVRTGDIVDINVPAFLLSGNIKGAALIKNTGNVHTAATYKLQVFPLFSNEEIYTNEEDPEKKNILPDRTLYNETAWEKTPEIGIYNVVYTVEFAGKTAQASKLVIKCPIWLLFIVLFVVAGIAIWLATRVWGRKSKRRA